MMKSSLDHLPASKQRELKKVEDILLEEFEDALSDAKAAWKKKGRVLKIILFGPYARGGWVDEANFGKGYRSDYDLLVVVNNKKLAEFEPYWHKAADRLLRERAIKTPVNFIVHSRRETNTALLKGHYFFSDIRKEGVVLYELDDEPLAEPRPLTPKDVYATARDNFEHRFSRASNYLRLSRLSLGEKMPMEAAFLLHQSIEQAYGALLLTLTNYSPPAHNIKFLRALAEGRDPRLYEAWPREEARHRAWFNRLVEAYVKARYSKHYVTDEEALTWLSARTEHLHKLIETACKKHLAKLKRAAARRKG